MPVIETQALTKRYPKVTALADLSVTVEPGITGLVGANGAGKSTLVKILLGLVAPTSGTAIALGYDVVTEGPKLRELVGYMPEHDCLPTDVSATELVVHLARISGLPATAARERAADTLRHVGLHEERYRSIGEYSTGMRQRVKLAQALAHDPKLLLLDEPTNGLDPRGRDEMLTLIKRIGTRFGISVLVTSHLLGELERIADRVVILDAGQLLRSSTTADFTRETQFLLVEVTDRAGGTGGRDAFGAALAEQGLTARPAGRLVQVALAGERTYDVVRDTATDLGLGLVRLERRHHRMDEVFRTDSPTEPTGEVADAGAH